MPIALIDPAHVQHNAAHGKKKWATCPLTENGVLRIVGHVHHPNSPGHVFWPDDISLLDTKKLNSTRILSSAQVTGSYLLALACAHGGKLATFDRRMVADAVRGGAKELHLIG